MTLVIFTQRRERRVHHRRLRWPGVSAKPFLVTGR